ncbi:MAG: F0F1 ATP synthase subunit A [Armatimonadetes bacterium]|nr:F0F1 ATP synthase subunit A [Armatimonadota bacterium]
MVSNFMLIAAAGGGDAGFGFHNQLLVASTAIVVFLLIVLALVARGQLGEVPVGWAAAFEHVFDWLDDLARDMMGPEGRNYVPLAMSIFLFVLLSNWSGVLPWPAIPLGGEARQTHAEAAHDVHILTFETPTTSYNTTLMLALISFVAFNWFGIAKQVTPRKAQGEHDHDHHGGPAGIVTWILHFVQPTPVLWKTLDGWMRYALVPLLGVLFVVLNIVEELARILSLSIRLFGNIFGEHQVKHNLLLTMQGFLGSAIAGFTAGAVVPFVGWGLLGGLLWLSSLFAIFLGGLAGFIQAMIFAVLTLTYIAHAVADEH